MSEFRTVEEAKNPDVQLTVRCSQCGHEDTLSLFLVERTFQVPYHQVSEGLLVCPQCGDSHHSYYLGPEARYYQDKLKEAIAAWHRRKDFQSLKNLELIKARYAHFYERDQTRYAELSGELKP